MNAVEEHGIRIMLARRQWLRSLGRPRVRFGWGAAAVVMMVMAASAMMMVAVVVTSRNKIRMNMRTKIVSGRLDAAV